MAVIVVPLDGSEASRRALPEAERVARGSGARVVVLAIEASAETSEQAREVDEMDAQIFEHARAHFAGLDVRERAMEGDATAAILATAEEEHADLVVMAVGGSRSRSAVALPMVARALRAAGVRVDAVRKARGAHGGAAGSERVKNEVET